MTKHTDLTSKLDQVLAEPAPSPQRSSNARARREKKRLSPMDGRVRRGLGRDRQFKTNVTQDLLDLLEDMVSEYEFTKAEFTERAFRFYAKHVRAGTADE